jgi:hypothetical protein
LMQEASAPQNESKDTHSEIYLSFRLSRILKEIKKGITTITTKDQ